MKKRTDRVSHTSSRFWKIYFAVMAAVLLIVVVALKVVAERLAEYESAQPKYVAAEVFAQYFEPINYAALLADAHYDAGDAEADEIEEYLKEEIGDSALTYSIGSANDSGEIKYIVKAGAKQLASIILSISENETKHGFQTYEFSYVELHLNTNVSVEPIELEVAIEVPASYSVMVDGVLLTEDLLTSNYIKTDIMPCYPPDITGVEYVVYAVTGLEELPKEIVVTDAEGQNAEVSFDENTNTYTSGVTYSQSLAEKYSEFVTAAMQGYAAYVQASKDVGLGDIKSYFDTESDVYADVVAAGGNRWMVLDWNGVDYENVSVGEFYAHTPEVFSCHISFAQVLHRTGREDYVDYVDMYVFLHLTEKGYKIFGWHNV